LDECRLLLRKSSDSFAERKATPVNPDTSTRLPRELLIDYVRVHQRQHHSLECDNLSSLWFSSIAETPWRLRIVVLYSTRPENESGERSGVSPPVPHFCTGKLTHAAPQLSHP
jgi:hypothetical protein